MSYHYNQLTPVIFGKGAVNELGEKVKEMGCKKVMCVYDSGVKAAGIAPKAEASLKAAGIDYVVFDKITADPTDELVNECGALGKAEGVDCFVGVGGGSSMDCAKAASLLMVHEPPIQQYFTAPPSYVSSPIPVILVPTTAGTGSEVTQVCVITNTADHSKPAIYMRSKLAIVDPDLTMTVPPSVTANTGLDAFTHAAEALTAKGHNPRSDLLATAALGKIAKYLPIAVADGSNEEARYELSLAANWAGIAFADTDCHLGHCMADGISAAFHTPHGMNCIWVDPELMKACASVVPERVKMVGEAIGVTYTGSESNEEIGEKTAAAIRALMKAAKLRSPKEMGLDRDTFINCYKMAMEIDLGLRLNCPLDITPEMVRDMYEKAYDNYQ